MERLDFDKVNYAFGLAPGEEIEASALIGCAGVG
jgi:hypothetical protein